MTTHNPTTATRHLANDPLDGNRVKQDFPILNQPGANGLPVAFLDSASSSQKPQAVIDAIVDYYTNTNANIHRGVYHLSEKATAAYEQARATVAAFINAPDPNEVIFVRNTTEGINLVASSWGRTHLKPGDLIVSSLMEHHANLVSWQLVAEQTGAEIAHVALTADDRLDLESYDALLARKPKVVALTHVSNSLGTVNDVTELTRRAKAVGAMVVIDGAQSVPHLAVDVQAIGCDFLAFSGHKMLGPMGIGVLWGRMELLDAMPPYMGGGGMIKRVDLQRSTYADVPARFEAGTPSVADAIGLAAAVDYLNALGMDRVRAHELEILAYAEERLGAIPGLTLFGPRDLGQRSGVASFDFGDIHPHDIAAILDEENVAVRAGHHCNQPLMRHLGVVATTRASFYVYTTLDDIDRLASGLERCRALLG